MVTAYSRATDDLAAVDRLAIDGLRRVLAGHSGESVSGWPASEERPPAAVKP
jgi:hypothetical protein